MAVVVVVVVVVVAVVAMMMTMSRTHQALQALVSMDDTSTESGAAAGQGVLYVLRDLDESAVACLSFLEDACARNSINSNINSSSSSSSSSNISSSSSNSNSTAVAVDNSSPTLAATAFRFLSLWLSENPGLLSDYEP